MRTARAAAFSAALAWSLTAGAEQPSAQAVKAERAIAKLDVEEARAVLANADVGATDLAIARGLLALYRGDCDGAAAVFARPDLQKTDEGEHYGDVARGCARTMAAAVLREDEASGILARFQDERDAVLLPWVAITIQAMRPVFERDLGVTMPKRILVEVVHDQMGLSAMTGLPEDAARTTGTVAIAKWGRVVMLSPRAAMGSGYRWQDTLAHELTHLAIARGSGDRAPLWLHEGIAKREETLWRAPDPTDEIPSVDALAAVGMAKGFGRPIENLGPSLAMLPTPDDARVAYAEVTSFMRFWMKEAGPRALPDLLGKFQDAKGDDPVGSSMKAVSGADLKAWGTRWKTWLDAGGHTLPDELAPGGKAPTMKQAARGSRLAELLGARGHREEALPYAMAAHQALPKEGSLRAQAAAALFGLGKKDDAAKLVADAKDLHSASGRWYSLHALLVDGDAERPGSFLRALSIDPFDPDIACEESKEIPKEADKIALCLAARAAARPKVP